MKNLTLTGLLCGLLMVLVTMSAYPIGAQDSGEDITIGKYVKLYSQILNEERTLLIHLPQGYEKSTQRYPVLYLLYGNHVTTYFAEAVATLDGLGRTARIPEMILVGLTNTNRYRDLLPQNPDGSPTGIADFLSFFEKEFIPYVENNYRVKNYRLILGPQAGANFVMYSMFEKPELFNACFIDSPFRWRGGRDILAGKVERFLQNNSSFKNFLYITYEDSDPLAVEGIKYINDFYDLVKSLKVKDFQVNLNFIEGNDEFIPPLGLRTGLKTLFKEYPFPETTDPISLPGILDYYVKLSGQYGFEVDVPDHVLTMEGNEWMQKGNVTNAEAIFAHMLEKYPNSANAFFGMANIKLRDGKLEEARDFYQKMVSVLNNDVGMILARVKMLEKRIGESAAYAVEKEIRKADFSAGVKMFRAPRADSETKLYFDEREFNELGYRLLGYKKPDEAIQIFQLNIEMFPKSANAYDSLAEAYLLDGQGDLAIRNYQRSLELDPENENAKQMLKQLRKKK